MSTSDLLLLSLLNVRKIVGLTASTLLISTGKNAGVPLLSYWSRDLDHERPWEGIGGIL